MRPRSLQLLALASCSVFAAPARAQIHQDWLKATDLAPSGRDEIYAVAAAASGNVYAAGQTGAYDLLLEKIDAAGNLAWAHSFDFSGGIDDAQALLVDPTNEDVFVFGRGDFNSTRGLAQRYDTSGALIWTQEFDAPFGTAQFYCAGFAPNGQLVAAAGLGQGGFALCGFDKAGGTLLWTGYEPNGDYPSAIAFDGNGDILVSGSYYGVGSNSNFGVTRFSSNGTYLWTRLVSGGGYGYQSASALLLDGAGNAYVTGRLIDLVLGAREALVKLDSAGNVVWTATHQGTQPNSVYSDEGLESLGLCANGNIRAAGVCSNTGTGRDLQALEYTPAGQLVWQASWSAPASFGENCIGMQVEADGTLTVLATTRPVANSTNPALVRFDAQGNFLGADIDDLTALGTRAIFTGGFGPGGACLFAGRTPAAAPTDALVLQLREQSNSYCFGDGSSGACPCANSSPAGEGRGCANSSGTSARLTSSGVASLSGDGLVLTSTGELASAPSIFLQAAGAGAPAHLGDGILCLGGSLKRMFVHSAAGGVASAPSGSDASFSARSAALGDVIAAGSQRYYQVIYRDPVAGFCAPPSGSSYNLSSALSVLWVP